MILKVDPDELLNVTKIMKKDSERFKKEIDNMQSSLNVVASNWKGTDANAFVSNFTNFLKKMKSIPASVDTFAEICEKTSNGYISRDEQFAKDLKGVAVENEE